ncbi:MAG: S41 family peptidase, partial [Acidimicrobiia bacterium]
VESGECHLVTDPEFRDVRPSFDPDGRFLYFVSYRTFDPVYDSHFFDLGFPRGMRPHLVTLRADEPSPFLATPKGFGPEEAQAPKEAPAAGDQSSKPVEAESATGGPSPGAAPDQPETGTKPLQIDLAGIHRRVIPFPLPEGRYGQVVGIKGKVLLTSFPVQGSLDRDVMEPKSAQGALEVYDLAEGRHEVLVSGVSSFEVSRDGHTLIYRADRKLRALRAGDKPSDGADPDPTGRRAGWLDLGRIRISVDPGAEWRQMLREAWRLQRDHFWVEDMSGVDWDLVLTRYLPLVGKVASRLEFSDLMWEMQGELGTSHAYELGGDHRPAPSYAMGHLGAEISYDDEAGAWRINSIVEGDSWDPAASSPLTGPGVNVSPGDLLLAVNGRSATATDSPASLLVNQAGSTVELGVAGPDGSGRRNIVVVTMRDERPARYREWVSRNRQRVHQESGGRVGYVHVPDMGPGGYAEFHRSYLHEVEREALVVDVRFNGGGHVSQLVLEKLARRRIGYDLSRWGSPDPYPNDSPGGPLVALANEYAGSDGDIFTHSFKLLGLGPVIGKRTWGGVIGISPSHLLVDGSVTTQPEYAFWFNDVGWGLENYGADPDIEVDIRPQDHAAGLDPQLERAISSALEALGGHRPRRPDLSSRPQLALPVLPMGIPGGPDAPTDPPAKAPGRKRKGNGKARGK